MTYGGSICDQNVLGSSRAPTPTGRMDIVVTLTDGGAFCDRISLYHLSGGYTATSLLANLTLSEAKHALLKESLFVSFCSKYGRRKPLPYRRLFSLFSLHSSPPPYLFYLFSFIFYLLSILYYLSTFHSPLSTFHFSTLSPVRE